MNSSPHQQFLEIIKSFPTCMLVSIGPGNLAHSRPMAVARVDFDGDTYLVTSSNSAMLQEIADHPDVVLIFQGTCQFASLAGEATISDDRNLIDELWSESWRVWFPAGKADPTLRILRIIPSGGEYWDNGGLKGMKYLFTSVSALMLGTKPAESDPSQHAKIDF